VKKKESFDPQRKILTRATRLQISSSSIHYRIAAKIVVREAMPALKALPSPLQLGIGEPGACESYVHNTREKLRDKVKKLACVTADIDNAFNSISRSHVIKAVFAEPQLAMVRGLMRAAYGSPTPLLARDRNGRYSAERIIMSENGVRQGDPPASSYYAMGVNESYTGLQTGDLIVPLMDEEEDEESKYDLSDQKEETSVNTAAMTMRELHPDMEIHCIAFHDDLSIIGEPKVIAEAFRAFRANVAKIGLKVQPLKSLFVDFHLKTREKARRQCIRENVGRCKLRLEENLIIVLGCPVGANNEVEREFMMQKLKELLAVVGMLLQSWTKVNVDRGKKQMSFA